MVKKRFTVVECVVEQHGSADRTDVRVTRRSPPEIADRFARAAYASTGTRSRPAVRRQDALEGFLLDGGEAGCPVLR